MRSIPISGFNAHESFGGSMKQTEAVLTYG